MYRDTIDKIAESAAAKASLIKENIVKYFLASMLAGIYVGFGVILVLSIGAPFAAADAPSVKLIMGASFGIALTMVILGGAELFTGNNMVMIVGGLSKKASLPEILAVWGCSFFGNLAGALLLVLLIHGSGIFADRIYTEFITNLAAAKMNMNALQLFLRGILCNLLVCLAVWTCTRVKEDTAKIFVVFWCLFAFVASGFEHSIANMTLLAVPLFAGGAPSVTWAGYARNLIFVTAGNILGGSVFVGVVYFFISTKKKQPEH